VFTLIVDVRCCLFYCVFIAISHCVPVMFSFAYSSSCQLGVDAVNGVWCQLNVQHVTVDAKSTSIVACNNNCIVVITVVICTARCYAERSIATASCLSVYPSRGTAAAAPPPFVSVVCFVFCRSSFNITDLLQGERPEMLAGIWERY